MKKKINMFRIMSVIATNSKKRTVLRWVLFSLSDKDKKIGQLKLP
jgi:hypothetical protein